MNYRKLVASKDEKKIAGNILHDIFFNDHDDGDASGQWLQTYLELRTPGVEQILAADNGSENNELPYDSIPSLLVDLYGSELFEAERDMFCETKFWKNCMKTKNSEKFLKSFLPQKECLPIQFKTSKYNLALIKVDNPKNMLNL